MTQFHKTGDDEMRGERWTKDSIRDQDQKLTVLPVCQRVSLSSHVQSQVSSLQRHKGEDAFITL